MEFRKWAILICAILIETVGNVAVLILIHFEKYGMDPLKRNVTNQLTSSLCFAGFLMNIIGAPGAFYR